MYFGYNYESMRFIDLKTRAVVKKNRYLLRQERARSFRAIAAVQLKIKQSLRKIIMIVFTAPNILQLQQAKQR